MASKLTLNKLAENLIRESNEPFSTEDYINRIQERWRRKISPSTLADLRQKLVNHNFLIGMETNDYLPYKAVLERLGSVPVSVAPGKMEIKNNIFLLGHRLIPFISGDLEEDELKILDANGLEIPKVRKSFCVDDVIHYYQYSNDCHFPDKIKVNEWAPGKSTLPLTVWDMTNFYADNKFKIGDELLVRFVDYDKGVFGISHYPARLERNSRLKVRSFHLALEAALLQLCASDHCSNLELEKQLLRVFFSMKENVLKNIPAFSLPKFVESLERLSVERTEKKGARFILGGDTLEGSSQWEPIHNSPEGKSGSLQEIFEDLGLACNAVEFKTILYVVMGTDDFDIESIFALLFGGREGNFYDDKQHKAFYRQLRKILAGIYEELKLPEPRIVSEIRNKSVSIKMRLIEISRYLETIDVNLEDLPTELLDQIGDLDYFCVDALTKLSDRLNPPDVKSISDIRLALRLIQPTIDQLEEEIFYKLGVY
jgi:hypothetical protein